MREIDLLSGILTKTGDLVAGVSPDQLDAQTPCPEYDVGALVVPVPGDAPVIDRLAGFTGRDPAAVG